MKHIKLTALAAVSAALLTLGINEASAQNAGNGGNGGNGADRRAEFRARMNERLKTSLKVTDDEWAVLQPLIEKVQTAQREAGGFGGFGGGPGGFGGGRRGGNGGNGGNDNGGGTPPAPDLSRPGAAEAQALRTTLESDGATPDEIKAKLAAVRDFRKKGQATLASAREDLKKVLTLRQEAVLVSMGILD